MYTSPCVRADTCYAISRLARALTFTAVELSQLADQVMLYMAQTAADRVTFDGNATDADQLHAMSDSDSSVGNSTTGWAIFLAGAAVAYASKRQPCIAMSSTEAEVIAASSCAFELSHFRSLLAERASRRRSRRPSMWTTPVPWSSHVTAARATARATWLCESGWIFL